MNFKDIVAIIISRPFFAAMCNGGVLALNVLIGRVLISEDMAVWQGEAMNVFHQHFGLRGVNCPLERPMASSTGD